MNPIGLIIKREYLHRVSKKSFLLLTILTPFLFAAMVFVPLWLSTIKDDEAKKVAIIDQTSKYEPLFEDTESYTFITSDKKQMDAYRQSESKDIMAFISITDDLLKNPKAITIYSNKQVPRELSQIVERKLNKALSAEKIASYNIPDLEQIIKDAQVDLNIETIKWSDEGKEEESSVEIASVIGMLFTMIIYMFILIYGAMVMQSVLEEKTNRIVELIVSSVRPFQLMLGKITAIGMVGLTQFFIWSLMTGFLVMGIGVMFGLQATPDVMTADTPELTNVATNEIATKISNAISTINFQEIIFLFIIYFVGGYFMYASILAAIGAMVDNQEDTQQFMTPIMILIVFALYAGIYSIENPDGPLAFWCSIIPLTSPIVMMIRLPFEVPLWEKVLSIALLYITAFSITWLSARIYRIGILIYGKKPTVKEIIKWLKYS